LAKGPKAVPAGILLVYALILMGEFSWSAVVPLVPTFAAQLHLSQTTAGLLAGATGLAVLAIAVPSGMLADRYGARRLTLISSALMSGALLAHAIPGFWPLLAARFVFGLGFGTVWTAGIAWIGELAPRDRREQMLARPMAIAGFAFMVGPVFGGVVGQSFGVRTPFVATGFVGLAIGLLLLRVPEPRREARPATPSLGETLRRAAREPVVVASLGLMLIASCASSAIYLLVPLQLHDDGLSARGIGAAFSIAALVFACCSILVGRLGARATRLVVGGAASGLLAAVLLLPVASATVPSLVGLLVLRAPLFAVLFGIAFPLAAWGADRAGIGHGVVLGLLNGVWAAATVIGPIAGGALADAAGRSAVYLMLVAGSLLAAIWLLPRRIAAPATR
jgi:MFS transporter, DHA1 family, tetracycline resistance protein